MILYLLHSIWARLQERSLTTRCERVQSRKATLEELETCHAPTYCQVSLTTRCERVQSRCWRS